MTTSVQLIALKCLRCAELIPAEENEVAWVCGQCSQGVQLTDDGLAPLDVNWAAAKEKASAVRWLPFWVFDGAVTFSRRKSFGLLQHGPDKLWEARRRFYVPAFSASLEQLETLGADLTRKQVQLKADRPAGGLNGCVMFPQDARQAIEFIVLTIEAERKDKLREVDFSLDLSQPDLWVLPFEGERIAIKD